MFKITIWLLAVLMSGPALSFSPQELWDSWPGSRFETTAAPCLLHARLSENLLELQSRYPHHIRLEEVGKSFQGRSIKLLSMGQGDQKILLWSQMHGDEPSATPALLDIAQYLTSHAEDPAVIRILETFTLLMIPMLNPDGAENYVRRNAQGIDINRDALNLVTPEGRILKAVRDRYEPMMGFNLHDQNRRTTVGNTGVLATNSVLSVSGDAANTLTPGRERTKRASAAIVEALAPFMPGGMARYDEDWSPRAFGDNLTAWGTPVVLIESGGLPPDHDFTQLTRLNFVAILTVINRLAIDDLASQDPQVYENLRRNQSDAWSDIAVRGGRLMQPGSIKPFEADLAFDVLRSDQHRAGCAGDTPVPSAIFLVGDASLHGSGTDIDASGKLLLAPFDVRVESIAARSWLNPETLVQIAKLGVGRVFWTVDPAQKSVASEYARTLALPGRPLIFVTGPEAVAPKLVLDRPPPAVNSNNLADSLLALGANPGETKWAALLTQLWIEKTEDNTNLPRLRKHQPASFLIVSPAPDGLIDLDSAKLESVWLDGHRLER